MSHCLFFISFLLCAILKMVFLQLFYLMFLGFVAFDSIVLLRRILNILVLSSLRIFSKSIHFFIPVIALEMLNMLIPAMYTVFSWFAAIIQQWAQTKSVEILPFQYEILVDDETLLIFSSVLLTIVCLTEVLKVLTVVLLFQVFHWFFLFFVLLLMEVVRC